MADQTEKTLAPAGPEEDDAENVQHFTPKKDDMNMIMADGDNGYVE